MWPFSTPVFKSELFFSKGFYYYLMVSNLLLRLAWTYKLSPHLRRNHDTVLAFTLLEVCGALSPPLPQPLTLSWPSTRLIGSPFGKPRIAHAQNV